LRGIKIEQKVKQYMTTKPPIQKILLGILYIEDERKGWEVISHRKRTDK
jgi:hypothetical protein